jgi:hypothetical protein
MKNVFIPVAVFTLTLLATTTWVVMKTPLPELPVDEIALADSLLADSLWRDSLATQHVKPNVDHEPTLLAEQRDATPSLATQMQKPSDSPTADAHIIDPAGPTLTQSTEAYQALARIFARMKPAEAADVLRHMSDREVEGVVRNLGARQAASVLANLPEARAAELARRLLNPTPDGEQ